MDGIKRPNLKHAKNFMASSVPTLDVLPLQLHHKVETLCRPQPNKEQQNIPNEIGGVKKHKKAHVLHKPLTKTNSRCKPLQDRQTVKQCEKP